MSAASSTGGFRRVFGEFVVVVLGVFVALAGESWWSERENRSYERELIDDILAEFETNFRILELDLTTNESSYVRLSFLNELEDAELLALSSEELTDRLGNDDWAGFDPEMGIVQALVESGNLGVISDRNLRLYLSKWSGLLEEKRRFNLQAVDFQSHDVVPAFARASADLVWTEAERREAQTLFRSFTDKLNLVIENQQRLRATARDISAYVETQG